MKKIFCAVLLAALFSLISFSRAQAAGFYHYDIDAIYIRTALYVEDAINSKIAPQMITDELIDALKKETENFLNDPIESGDGKNKEQLKPRYFDLSVQITLSNKEAIPGSGEYLAALYIKYEIDKWLNERPAEIARNPESHSFVVPFTYRATDERALKPIRNAFLEAFRRNFKRGWVCNFADVKCAGYLGGPLQPDVEKLMLPPDE